MLATGLYHIIMQTFHIRIFLEVMLQFYHFSNPYEVACGPSQEYAYHFK